MSQKPVRSVKDAVLKTISKPKTVRPKARPVCKPTIDSFKLENSDSSGSESDTDSEEYIEPIKRVEVHNKRIKIPQNIPWIEKYRPRNVDDIVLDKNTLNKIKRIVQNRDMPNLIITGVPGVGKTTTILCIARTLLGSNFDQGVLELNASDERGVKNVHESIEYFCKQKSPAGVQHKIVLLDEADTMTKKSQQAINNLMEQYHETRFAFTCNNSSDIIEAIQSRCIIFRYIRLSPDDISLRLKKICEIEKIPYTDLGLETLIETAQGDLRQAINNLQLTYYGFESVTQETVNKLCDRPHPLIIQGIFEACQQKDLVLALKRLEELREKGYSSYDISMSMFNTLKSNKFKIDEDIRMKFMIDISKTCLVINRGINTPLQLSGCIAALCQCT